MCAINPVHKKRFIIDVYTSRQMSKEDFDSETMSILLMYEQYMNGSAIPYRFHLKESEQEAE